MLLAASRAGRSPSEEPVKPLRVQLARRASAMQTPPTSGLPFLSPRRGNSSIVLTILSLLDVGYQCGDGAVTPANHRQQETRANAGEAADTSRLP
jgi:hypothetical protein